MKGRCAWLCALALAAMAPAGAEPAAYRVVPAQTSVEFSVLHLAVFPAHGRFGQVSGRIVIDAGAASGNVQFDVATASVATGWSLRDAFLRGEAMFDAGAHPLVRFRSTRLEFAAGRLVRIDGDLTLRGVTRPVSLAVSRLDCNSGAQNGRDVCEADAESAISRRDFDMDFAWPLIGDDVELRFRIVAIRE